MNKKGYTIIELLVVLSLFSVLYAWGVNKTSHAFKYDKSTVEYEEKITLIETIASAYADANHDLFKEKNTVYIYVDDLIEAGYLKANEAGDIKDPRSANKTLNNLKLKITKTKSGASTSLVKLDE